MGYGHGRGIWGSGGRIWPGEAVSWVGEALSGAAEAVVWAGCTMAQRGSNDVFGPCFGAQMSMLKQVGNNILYCKKKIILILVYPIFRSLRIKTVF